MHNMASVIQNYNTNLLKNPAASTAEKCSYQQKSSYWLAEKCFSECLVYHAQVDGSDIKQTKHYYSFCEKNFKEPFNNHAPSFRNKSKERCTEISKYIWSWTIAA